MFTKRNAIVLLLILVTIVSALGTIENVKATSENWVEVTRYSGEGFIGLYPREKFTVSHSEWRAKWHVVKGDMGSGFFHLEISLSRYEAVGIVNRESSDPLSGTVVVHNQNRTFFIQVDIAIVESWEVIIEENVDSPLLDITDPIVSIISPENQTYYSEPVELSYVVNEPTSSMWYQINYGNDISLLGNKTQIEVSLGEHNLIVYAKDEAGNIGFSETMYFSVEEPFLTVWIVIAIVILTVAVIGLLVYFKKRKH